MIEIDPQHGGQNFFIPKLNHPNQHVNNGIDSMKVRLLPVVNSIRNSNHFIEILCTSK